ncbi:hypothetical protein NFJ02_24g54800 [Pycnococcus provasolii]
MLTLRTVDHCIFANSAAALAATARKAPRFGCSTTAGVRLYLPRSLIRCPRRSSLARCRGTRLSGNAAVDASLGVAPSGGVVFWFTMDWLRVHRTVVEAMPLYARKERIVREAMDDCLAWWHEPDRRHDVGMMPRDCHMSSRTYCHRRVKIEWRSLQPLWRRDCTSSVSVRITDLSARRGMRRWSGLTHDVGRCICAPGDIGGLVERALSRALVGLAGFERLAEATEEVERWEGAFHGLHLPKRTSSRSRQDRASW